jgi:gamma-glutamyl-gamma-aminobutyrate hydrolase PuuD
MKEPLLLWGGVDIDSSLYEEPRHPKTQIPNRERDLEELDKIKTAVRLKVPIVGICRGAQLLCVYHGGRLYQHTKPHKQNHAIETKDGRIFNSVTSDHHQIMIPSEKGEVVGWNPSMVEVFRPDMTSYYIPHSPEIVWFEETKSIAIQPHPEWERGKTPFVQWINKFLYEKGIKYEF